MRPAATSDWSAERKKLANGVASVLYGVIAIMSAELAYQPGAAGAGTVAAGALLVGLAMALTRMFVELVKTETERGAHMGLGEAWALLCSSILVLAFPGAVAALVLVAELLGLPRGALADAVPYIGVATVMALGFGSSYVLDREPWPALQRGFSWTVLSLVLFAAKQIG
jgi:hypothetical protein